MQNLQNKPYVKQDTSSRLNRVLTIINGITYAMTLSSINLHEWKAMFIRPSTVIWNYQGYVITGSQCKK